MGQPEVHVELDQGDEPPALLTFTWQGVTWQTYVSNPGPGVEEPRVYLKSAGEDLSGVDRKPPNARVGPAIGWCLDCRKSASTIRLRLRLPALQHAPES